MTNATLDGPVVATAWRCPFFSRRIFGWQINAWAGWPFVTIAHIGECNSVRFAREELKRLRSGEPDEMQDAMDQHILRMVRTFSDEGHSGFSAGYAVSILEKLLRFEPITPLTGDDDEWMEVGGPEEPCWQNRRCSRVFKNADGGAYDIQGRVFVEPSGCSYTSRDSRVYVTFPYRPTTEYVRVNENGEPEPKT